MVVRSGGGWGGAPGIPGLPARGSSCCDPQGARELLGPGFEIQIDNVISEQFLFFLSCYVSKLKKAVRF